MAYLDPNEGFNVLRDQTVDEIKKHFPLTGARQSLHLEDVEFGHVPRADDIKAQHQAKISGDTWGVPVFGRVTLRDNATGKVIDRRKVKLVDLPKMTSGRYSYIVGGQEYQLENQWQLNPGVYTRRRQNGELESRFNLAGRGSFDIVFHPDKKQFMFNWGKSNLPLYPILRAAGMTDPELEKVWGHDILEANRDARGVSTVAMKFYKSDVGEVPASPEVAVEHLKTLLFNSKLRPDMTKLTLGHPYEYASGEAMTAATRRLLAVQEGQPEDDRDSLIFKSLRSAGEFAADHIRQAMPRIRTKVQRTVDNATNVREAFKTEFFNEPMRAIFRTSLARVPDQINPLEMVASSMQTTVMGPGGIQSAHKVMESSKLINQSHFGFIDPLHTPEGEKTGITLRLPLGVRKHGADAQLRAYNTKTKKNEWINPATFLQSNVVLPDQIEWKDGVPRALHPLVSTMGPDNHIVKKPLTDADYILRHSTQLWDIGSNMIPMLPSVSGPRASMAGRHMEQAISLVHREAPLVQVDTGIQGETFEESVGSAASHQAPVAGTVHQVRRDSILIKGADGTSHDVPLYDHYPLNDPRAMITSTATVKAGDTVVKGQTIADTNFSKNGVLALGTNMRVAYIPYKGLNYEDGVVISETAAKKFTSNHLYKPSLRTDDTVILDKRKFNIHHPGTFSKAQLDTIGDDGVVQVGTMVKPGDPLVVALRPLAIQDKTSLAHIHKSLAAHHSNASVAWDSDHPGEVIATHRKGKDIVVHVRTAESMQVGDKIAGRSANKGVVTRIIPDAHMPHDEQGKPVEVLLNPFGVPGRMNPAQIFETAASKIALKTGKPYKVRNFEPGVNYLEKVKADLAAHGIKDTEKLIDPLTKLPLGDVLVGHQYLHKLVHQVEKKVSVRSGMGLPGQPAKEHYDSNLQPVGGGHQGGQSIGSLGYYALLAHGAKANIREMNTWKSEGTPTEDVNIKGGHVSQHAEVWGAIQRGTPLPTPQPTFAFKKFESYLKGAGINMDKQGHNFVLSPLTDQQILRMSAGAIPDPVKVVRAKDVKELKGGLFDEKLTGGFGGTKWSHITLAEPLPNPTFEDPICSLLRLKGKEFEAVVSGTKGLSATGHVVEPTQGLTGGAAIEAALKRVNVKAELKHTLALLSASSSKSANINEFMKRAKYLRALDRLNIGAHEAYVLHHLPVLPPAMRPVTVLPSGDIRYDDINGLYAQFAMLNEQLAKPGLKLKAPPQFRVDLRKSLYDGVKALMGVGIPYERADQKGLLHTIQGIQPKKGFFQKTLMSRRQDLTARSVIVPEPALGLDEVGIPRDVAVKLFRPFIINKLVNTGMAPIVAQEHLAKNGELVDHALQEVVAERPVLMKRDPALHKYNVQGFKPRVVSGTAIQVHPLICGSYNADFDGDMVSLYVPIAHDAVQEAKKMMPSANLFNEATGKVMYQPTMESSLGIYRLTIPGQKTDHAFKTHSDVVEAFKNGHLKYSDVVRVGTAATTPGRVLVADTLPQTMQPYLLGSLDNVLTADKLSHVMATLAKDHAPDFGTVANRLKDLGNGASFGILPKTSIGKDVAIGAHTLELADFSPDYRSRSTAVLAAQAKVDEVNKLSLKQPEKDRRAVAIWRAADDAMKAAHKHHMAANPSHLTLMASSGGKPGWTQYKQLVLAPMTFQDSLGRDIPVPVTKSYSEGLDLGGYWTQMYGARRGTVMKVQEVQRPGYLTKLMMNTSMHMVVAEPDCGTDKGIALPVVDKDGRAANDVHDRYLAQAFKANGLEVPAGTVLTPSIVDRIRAAKKDATVIVRSPLKCEHEHGFCQKCLGLTTSGGLTPIGTNAGVVAAQTLGERAVQLSMRVFHCMHEHSVVLVRQPSTGRVWHTTLQRLFEQHAGRAVRADNGEESAQVLDLEVWNHDAWTAVTNVLRHTQDVSSVMAIVRARSGHFIVSQDNHPHMLRQNTAVCHACGTWPKKDKKTFRCRKCGFCWRNGIDDDAPTMMRAPRDINDKSHRARISVGPAPSAEAPPLNDGWLAGMFCAEGSICCKTENNYVDDAVGLCFSQNKNSPSRAKLETRLARAFPRVHLRLLPKECQFSSVKDAKYFQETFGRYSRNKGLPPGWSGYPRKWLWDFLAGVFDGDGTLSTFKDSANSMAAIDTTSVLLAQQLHHLLEREGIHATVCLTSHRELTRHQGMAVKFVVTAQVKRVFKTSVKMHGIATAPCNNTRRFEDVVDYVRPFFFATEPVVYDLSTEAGTLSVNGFWTHNTGGAAGGGGTLIGGLTKLEQLTNLPKTLPDATPLAMRAGTIDNISIDRTGATISVDGKAHHVGRDHAGNLLHHNLPGTATEGWEPPKVGMKVTAGQPLGDPGRTVMDPHALLEATGRMDVVQGHLANELHKLFKDEGVRRLQSEIVVKAMGNLTKVTNPGDHPTILRGEFHPTSVINHINATQLKNKRPIVHDPTLQGVSMLPLSVQEDWMAKLQHNHIGATILDAAATNGSSNIHGTHPVPGSAYAVEFGLTSTEANKPQYSHLKNVPAHHY